MSTVRALPPSYNKKCYGPNLPLIFFHISLFVENPLPLPFIITSWEIMEPIRSLSAIKQTNKNIPFNHSITHPLIHRLPHHPSRQTRLDHAHDGEDGVEGFILNSGVTWRRNILTRHIFSIIITVLLFWFDTGLFFFLIREIRRKLHYI